MTYRGLVDISSKASNSNNYTQCDSLLMGNKCGAHTVPYIKNKNSESNIAHEATTSKISEEQLTLLPTKRFKPRRSSWVNSKWILQRSICNNYLWNLQLKLKNLLVSV